jgi:hypothetical protein
MEKPALNLNVGDLIVLDIKRKFPVLLREGPGYTFKNKEPVEPGDVGLVLNFTTGHGMVRWILLLIASKSQQGWIPENVITLFQVLI